MNMILHNNPTALIVQGNALADPRFTDGDTLKTFDYVVANPPFSDKRWSTGLDPANSYERFKPFGVPPAKQGDYAYAAHRPHAEEHRQGRASCRTACSSGAMPRPTSAAPGPQGLHQGHHRPAPNLFYGTGIPACIIVVDKEDAHTRQGIFMIDASSSYMKDGPKNRLRAQDIHKIVDVFTRQLDVPKYSRLVSFAEIEKMVQPQPAALHRQPGPEDLQDIAGHLCGGIPNCIAALEKYWCVLPGLKSASSIRSRDDYSQLSILHSQLKHTIYAHPEFVAFTSA